MKNPSASGTHSLILPRRSSSVIIPVHVLVPAALIRVPTVPLTGDRSNYTTRIRITTWGAIMMVLVPRMTKTWLKWNLNPHVTMITIWQWLRTV
jgi:hypothetical protein